MKRFLLPTVVVAAVVLGIAAGYIANAYASQAVIADLEMQIRERDAQISSLNAALTEARNKESASAAEIARLDALLESVTSAEKNSKEQLARVENELGELRKRLGDSDQMVQQLSQKLKRAEEIVKSLENDRVLLSWMRTNPPGNRQGDLNYWNETRPLAVKSSPSLGFVVDRIINNLNIYYDWFERFPPIPGNTREELLKWCPSFIDWSLSAPPDVNLYNESQDQFEKEVFLVVISHISSMSDLFVG